MPSTRVSPSEEIIIQPDARGRVVLGKLVGDVKATYIATTSPGGVITLEPATVTRTTLDRIAAIDPTFNRQVEESLAAGDIGEESEHWEIKRKERQARS